MRRDRQSLRPRSGSRGYSLVELLVALTICGLVSAGFAMVLPPARAAFESTPALLDLQQRGRTAADVIAHAIRAAGGDAIASNELGPVSGIVPAVIPSGVIDGRFSRLTVIVPPRNPAQGVLDRDQAVAGGILFLSGAGCPAAPVVCGFVRDATALVFDGSGRFDVFTVASVDAALGSVSPDRWPVLPYAAGSVVLEADVHTLQLQAQPDGSRSLVRVTAAGAVQPIVDRVEAMAFEFYGLDPFNALVPIPINDLTDGPWQRGDPDGMYDEDVFRIRRVDVVLQLLAAPPSTAGRAFRFGVSLRNVS